MIRSRSRILDSLQVAFEFGVAARALEAHAVHVRTVNRLGTGGSVNAKRLFQTHHQVPRIVRMNFVVQNWTAFAVDVNLARISVPGQHNRVRKIRNLPHQLAERTTALPRQA